MKTIQHLFFIPHLLGLGPFVHLVVLFIGYCEFVWEKLSSPECSNVLLTQENTCAWRSGLLTKPWKKTQKGQNCCWSLIGWPTNNLCGLSITSIITVNDIESFLVSYLWSCHVFQITIFGYLRAKSSRGHSPWWIFSWIEKSLEKQIKELHNEENKGIHRKELLGSQQKYQQKKKQAQAYYWPFFWVAAGTVE